MPCDTKTKSKKPLPVKIGRLLVVVVLLYVAWLLVAVTPLQERILFPGATAWNALTRPSPEPDPAWERWELERTDGTRGLAWFRPAQTEEAQAPAVVFTHGNADIARNRTDMGERYAPLGVHTLLLEYPGYDGVDGSPGQEAIVADGLLALHKLAARTDVDPDRIVYHGHSIGGGVAAQLASVRTPAALVLESTFTSMGAMFNRYLIPSAILRHPFDTQAVLRELDVPVLIMHGELDVIIFITHATENERVASNATFVRFEGLGHDGCYLSDEYVPTITDFLSTHGVLPE